MSQKEIDRLEVAQKLKGKQISQIEAARCLGVSSRQIRRLMKRYADGGAAGLVSKRRGKPSNNRLSAEVKASALALVATRYKDFGPTFANEKLREIHGLALSVESLRQLMIQEGLWEGKRRKYAKSHQMRTRRSCFGELIQIDGSEHDWFEGRAPECCLLVFVDDATSRLLQLHFVPVECTQGYFDGMYAYLLKHGRPVALYSDRHNIFRVNMKEAVGGTGETQFSRAMRELGIELICANSPQAKGRIERANGTLQNRLIKEMRLRNISGIDAANAFLPKFMADYNKRFAIMPADASNAHRKSLPDKKALRLILSHQEERIISKNLEISYNNRLYQIQTNTPGYTMRGAKIKVIDNKGEIVLQYKNQRLAYKTYDKSNRPTPVIESKQLDKAITKKINQPKANHPWKHFIFGSKSTSVTY